MVKQDRHFYFRLFIEPNYAQIEPGTEDLPERLSVVKIVDNANVGVAEVADEGIMFKILACIDSGERVPMEQIPDYDFKDGFEIIVEYEIHEDLIMHSDMARHMVIMVDETCWLNDDRVKNSAQGSSFRMMDGDFYGLLEGLMRSRAECALAHWYSDPRGIRHTNE